MKMLINKNTRKKAKYLLFRILNLVNKKYIVDYENDEPQFQELEKYQIIFDKKYHKYLSKQKLIKHYEFKKQVSQNVFFYNNIIVDTLTGVHLNSFNYKIKKSSLKYPSLVPYTFLSKINNISEEFDHKKNYYFIPSLNKAYYHRWLDGLIYLYYLSLLNGKYTLIVLDKIPDSVKQIILCFKDEFDIHYVSSRFINLPRTIKFNHISWAKHSPVITKKISKYFKSKVLSKPININSFDKIFIGRKKTPTRKILNNEEVIKTFEDYGFKVVYLEEYSIAEQAYLFNNARIIAGLHGAGFTNLIFCKPDTKVIELQNLVNVTTYFMISNQLKLDYHYVLPEEFNFEAIQDPYNNSRKFFKQKLQDTSYSADNIISLLNVL